MTACLNKDTKNTCLATEKSSRMGLVGKKRFYGGGIALMVEGFGHGGVHLGLFSSGLVTGNIIYM